jgi:catechol 2,3-dioxygenase-like lactoylglutathione lyase family enzyme
MIKHFDHVTIVVEDVEAAKQFFGFLGFEEDQSVTISGEQFSRYMRIDGIEAEHHTLVLTGSAPRLEVQLLRYLHPSAMPNPNLATRREVGFNHICFAVDDVAAEVRRLRANGVETVNEIMDFHDRKLVFLCGPEGITVELAQWL